MDDMLVTYPNSEQSWKFALEVLYMLKNNAKIKIQQNIDGKLFDLSIIQLYFIARNRSGNKKMFDLSYPIKNFENR